MKCKIFLNMAMTLDGKIRTRDMGGSSFASDVDRNRMLEIRTLADAIICGARTIADSDATFTPRKADRELRVKSGMNPEPIKCIVSATGSVPDTAQVFTHNDAPTIIFSTTQLNGDRLRRLQKIADVRVIGENEVDLNRAVEILAEDYNVKRLLVEGGGTLNFGFFKAGLIDEVFLTLCPKLAGGRNVPTIADGNGLDFAQLVQFKLLSHESIDDEIFLHYSVKS